MLGDQRGRDGGRQRWFNYGEEDVFIVRGRGRKIHCGGKWGVFMVREMAERSIRRIRVRFLFEEVESSVKKRRGFD